LFFADEAYATFPFKHKIQLYLALIESGEKLSLEIQANDNVAAPVNSKATPSERIFQILAAKMTPMSLSSLRESCSIRTATLCETLKEMLADGAIRRTQDGYTLNLS